MAAASDQIVGLTLLLCGAIHLLPTAGLLGAARLEALYGVKVGGDPNLSVLLRHRALLFGLLGVPLAWASFRREWQPAAITAGLVSTGSFIALCRAEGERVNAQLRRVSLIDSIVVGGLAVSAALLYWRDRA